MKIAANIDTLGLGSFNGADVGTDKLWSEIVRRVW